MNLYAYDKVTEQVNKRCWLDVKREVLITKDIKIRPYHLLLKKFNPDLDVTQYYICMLDDEAPNDKCFKTIVDDYGRAKIKIHTIFTDLFGINPIKNRYVKLEQIEEADDGDIYLININ